VNTSKSKMKPTVKRKKIIEKAAQQVNVEQLRDASPASSFWRKGRAAVRDHSLAGSRLHLNHSA